MHNTPPPQPTTGDNEPVRKGRLRIYLGAAPGVGKTVAMLSEGHRRAERGTDVVIGIVETHDRSYTTKMLHGLETIPRITRTHRGTTLTDLDVDAVLRRHPDVVLIDELAHTCIPGSPHRRRYEDIETLLQAGIDVISTVNIQHLESLNDAVLAITGVRQQETVPDHVVRGADQIELVDMSPESLRRRLAHGNVYRPERVDAALASYFRPGNLAALRELALLWLADRVDETLQKYRANRGINAPWPARERIVVGLTGGPEGEQLLRRATRIASRGAGSEVHAVYVTTSDGLTSADFASVAAQQRLTADLGATFHTVSGDDIATALLDFARSVNASQIVIGTSRRSRLSRLFDPGVGETVVTHADEIDIHMVNHDHAHTSGTYLPTRATLSRTRRITGFTIGTAGIALLTTLLTATRNHHDLPLDVLLYLALTVLSALIGGLGPALFTAIVGSLTLNWFFARPIHTFTIADPQNVVALIVFVLVAAAVSSAVHLSARRASQARAAEREAASLTRTSHAMLAAPDPLDFLVHECLDMFDMHAAAIIRHTPETITPTTLAATSNYNPTHLHDAAVREKIDENTELILIGPVLASADQSLVSAYASHAYAVLTRRALQAEAATAASLASDNRARTALLSAVSHDLRTPLAAVKAAVSSLRSTDVQFTPEDQAELLAAIEDSADRLNTLVGNLLDASRLHTGVVKPRCRALDITEEARTCAAAISEPHRIRIHTTGPTPGWADPGLLDRCLANLLENALHYSPPEHDVTIDIGVIAQRTQIRVVDTGPGVPTEDLERIFAPFQRRGDAPSGDGVGLGLAVARGLAETMGATITADETPGGGLTMTIDLPTTPPPPAATGSQP
ncbi:Sensor protein KdpD [Dermatophilus congolensis]|uniref:histidine kinase n=1 Tax=Dermatophilus congolensis TaxID=1863 RepID=A0AA46BLE8_9MICO|nr:Sensor protein KdpD [Dermatophilus congolensis]